MTREVYGRQLSDDSPHDIDMQKLVCRKCGTNARDIVDNPHLVCLQEAPSWSIDSRLQAAFEKGWSMGQRSAIAMANHMKAVEADNRGGYVQRAFPGQFEVTEEQKAELTKACAQAKKERWLAIPISDKAFAQPGIVGVTLNEVGSSKESGDFHDFQVWKNHDNSLTLAWSGGVPNNHCCRVEIHNLIVVKNSFNAIDGLKLESETGYKAHIPFSTIQRAAVIDVRPFIVSPTCSVENLWPDFLEALEKREKALALKEQSTTHVADVVIKTDDGNGVHDHNCGCFTCVCAKSLCVDPKPLATDNAETPCPDHWAGGLLGVCKICGKP
jgi:hypothetical protein